jgi:hypothetical protein
LYSVVSKKDTRVSNRNKSYFYLPFSFNKLVSKLGSVDQEKSTMAKKKKKKKKKKRKKERCRKNMKRKKKPEKEETLNSSKHFKPRRQLKTKMYSILKIFEVEGVAVEVEKIVTVVEAVERGVIEG